MKNNLQNNDFQNEIKAKIYAISALQKNIEEISIKHEKVLVQHKKKELAEKDNEISFLLNNLNNKNKQNNMETFSSGGEAFPCIICDKPFVSKDFLKSHIQNTHASIKYINIDIFKCRICGKEYNNRKLITKICVDSHIVVRH